MTLDAWVMVAILATMFSLLIFTKLPPTVVFAGALTLTITFHLAPLEESLKGFSNQGMLTIGALYMVAAGMYRTGAITEPHPYQASSEHKFNPLQRCP